MYNQERKQRYIKYKTSKTSVNNLNSIFNAAEHFEVQSNKDLCDFTTDEIRRMYKLSNINSIDVLINRNSVYKNYTSWAQTEGLVIDNQNHYSEFDINMLDLYLNKNALKQTIVDRETIFSWAERIVNPRDAFVLVCIFEFGKGDYFNDIVLARMKDIDLEEKTMKLTSGRTVKISDQLIYFAKKSNAADSIISANSERILYDDGSIMKRYGKAKDTVDPYYLGRAAYAALKRALEFFGVKISATNIMYSGIIDMIKRESEKLSISGEEYLKKYYSDIEYQYDVKIKPTIFMKKYGDYI